MSSVYCPPPIKSRPRSFGANIGWVTITGQAIGGCDIDFLVTLPFPSKVISIASILTITNSVWLHFEPLNKNYAGGNLIVPTGREHWIPMTRFAVSTAAPWDWTKLVLKDAVSQFYLDMGHENGAANTITFMCMQEPGDVDFWGGPWS